MWIVKCGSHYRTGGGNWSWCQKDAMRISSRKVAEQLRVCLDGRVVRLVPRGEPVDNGAADAAKAWLDDIGLASVFGGSSYYLAIESLAKAFAEYAASL